MSDRSAIALSVVGFVASVALAVWGLYGLGTALERVLAR